MPRKQWSKLRSDAVAAAHKPSADTSHRAGELAEGVRGAMDVADKLADSRGNDGGNPAPKEEDHSDLRQQNDQEGRDKTSSTRKRPRVEASPDYTPSDTVAKACVEFSPVEGVQQIPPARAKRHATASSQSDSTCSPALVATAANDGSVELDSLSRIEAEVLQQHGLLTQLNNLYLPEAEGNTDNSNTTKENPTKGKVEKMEDHLHRRRDELLQISPRNLALYIHLAERGIDAVDRPFVTCVVKRAQMVVAEWVSSFT